MSSTNPPTVPSGSRLRSAGKMRVTQYDTVSSMLIAMLVLFGSLAGIMVVVWLTSRVFASNTGIPLEYEPIGHDEDSMSEGDSELDTPSEEPMDDIEPAETLAAVADAVANKLSMLDRARHGTGTGDGTGGGPSGKPRRWEVRFPEGMTTKTYGRLLDHFGIELGVVQPGGKVAYASNFSSGNPTKRIGAREAEKRYYLSWKHGNLRAADEELLSQAGIDGRGQIVLKFLTGELESQLIQMKNAKAGSRQAKIYKTIFGVRTEGNGYAFYVLDQRYK